VEVAISLTLWLTFGAFMFLQTVDAPPEFARVAIGLCASEFVATLLWTIGREDCAERSCSPLTETARAAAGYEIPGLAVGMLVVGTVFALRASRNC
jgi:hypothetical protein